MAKIENDILLKTKLFGFDKAGAMDYIEKIQLENEGLKRQVQDLSAKQNALLKENAMLRSKLEVLGANAETGARQSFTPMPTPELMENGAAYTGKVTFEDLSEPAKQPPKKVVSKNTVVKKGGKTYITSKK